MALFMAVFMALWSAAFQVGAKSAISGYTYRAMIWYLVMTETIVLSTSRIFMEISDSVKAGDLAYRLVRPISYPFIQVAQSLGNAAPRFAVNLLAGFLVVGLALRTIEGSVEGFSAFLLLAFLGLLLDSLVAVLIGLAAFWIEDVTPVSWIYQKLLFTAGGMLFPLELFPGWLQRVVEYLPFRLIVYAPARAFVAFDGPFFLNTVLHQILYILLLGGVVMWLWSLARRRLVVQGG